jgi:hypothetical protein
MRLAVLAFSITLCALVSLAGLANANTLSLPDAQKMNELLQRVVTEITDLTSVARGALESTRNNGDMVGTTICHEQISQVGDRILLDIYALYPLVEIAAQVIDKTDEFVVLQTIKPRIEFALQVAAQNRQNLNRLIGSCANITAAPDSARQMLRLLTSMTDALTPISRRVTLGIQR